MPNIIFVVDSNGGIIHANNHAKSFFIPSNAGGTAISSFLPLFSLDTLTEDVRVDEVKVDGRDGNSTIFKLLIVPFQLSNTAKDNLNGNYWLFQLQDITPFFNSEQEWENLFYEINFQLNSIVTSIHSIYENLARPEVKNKLESIDRVVDVGIKESTRLKHFLNDMEVLLNIESGKIKKGFSPKKKKVAQLVSRAVEKLENEIKKKKIEILASGLDSNSIVAGDKSLEEVFLIILRNAVVYSQNGGQIAVEIVEDREEISIAFSDNGIGIPDIEQPKIFNRFYRVSNDINMEVRSTGIGLYIAKYIVELHSGTIWVESAVGKGSKFTLILPKS